jgi:WD40 repeat protein
MLWDLEHMELPVYSADAHDGMINAVDGCGGILGGGAPELATAGRDGVVKIWDTRQRDVPVAQLNPAPGTARDCWAVAFGNSFGDDRVVAAGYDNGDVKLLDLRTGTLRWETNVKNGVCSLQFDRADIEMNKLVVTTLESRFYLFDMRTFHPEKAYASTMQKAHESTVWTVSHLPQNREVWMTSGGNGSLNLWK